MSPERCWESIIKEFARIKKDDSGVFGALLELVVYPFLKMEFGELEYVGKFDFKVKDKEIYIEVKKRKRLDNEQKKFASMLLALDAEGYLLLFDKTSVDESKIIKVFDTILGPAYLVRLDEPPSWEFFILYRVERFLGFVWFIIRAMLSGSKMRGRLSESEYHHILSSIIKMIIQAYDLIVKDLIDKTYHESILYEFRMTIEKEYPYESEDRYKQFMSNVIKLIDEYGDKGLSSYIDGFKALSFIGIELPRNIEKIITNTIQNLYAKIRQIM